MALQWVEAAILEVHEWIDLQKPTATVDVNNQQIDNVADATADDHVAPWGQIKDFITLGIEHGDSIIDRGLSAPPGGESTGDRYIVNPTGTGAWSGHDNEIAQYNGTGWDFQTPTEGLTVWVDDEDIKITWDGSAWVKTGGATLYTASNGVVLSSGDFQLSIDTLTADTAIGATDRIPIYDGANKYITFANFEGDISHANLLDLTTGDPHTQYQLESEKGSANGYAPLDASSDVPDANISSSSVTQHEGDIDHDALTNYVANQHVKITSGTTAGRPSAATYGVGYYWDTDNGTWHYSNGTTWQDITATAASHASTHVSGQSDEIDGDVLDIDWNPSYYTPATTPAEVTSVDELTAHLYGIDQALNGKADSGHNHDSAYISIVTTPTTGNFPQLTAGGELVNSAYDETSFDAAGTAASAVSTHEGLSDPHTGYQLESEKGASNGYCGLDASGLVLFSDLPTGTGAAQVAVGNHNHTGVYEPADATILKEADVDDTPVDAATTAPISSNWAYDHVAASDPHAGYQLESEKGANNGYCGLDASGLVLFSDLPTGTGSSQVAVGNHNHDSAYISIVGTPTAGNFPQLTAGGELVNSVYDETSFDAAGTAAGAISTHEGAGDPHPGYVLESREGVASGVATLDADVVVTEYIKKLRKGLYSGIAANPTYEGEVYVAYDQGRMFIGMNF